MSVWISGTGVLTSANIAAGAITAEKMASGVLGYSQVSTTTISGSAVTQVDFTGLDIATDGTYFIVCDITNATASLANFSIVFNDSAGAYSQMQYSANSTIAGLRAATAAIGLVYASLDTTLRVHVAQDIDGYVTADNFGSFVGSANSADIQSRTWITRTAGTKANVIKISILSDIANSIGIGSKFTLYKMAG